MKTTTTSNYPLAILVLIVFCFLSAFLLFGSASAQKVFIPDTMFRKNLTLKFPNCMVGDSMDITCSEVLTTTSIDVRNAGIADITGIEYFTSLKHLFARNNKLTSIPTLPATLEYLMISNNPFSAFPQLPNTLDSLIYSTQDSAGWINSSTIFPDSLTYLSFYNNKLTNFPAFPSNLKVLIFSQCSITSLAGLPSSLEYLNCSNNLLTDLSGLPVNLDTLICAANKLTSIPSLPDSLKYLDCSGASQCDYIGNWLTNLPPLPNTLTYLDCKYNKITSLPTLPDSLKTLICSGQAQCPSCSFLLNQLSSLPSLPPSLTKLVCNANNLSSLPLLPATLTYLDCGTYYTFYSAGNFITALPPLPNGLTFLECGSNLLTSLPNPLPDSLKFLSCSGWFSSGQNQINTMPPLPPLLESLTCRGNNLSSIPPLPNGLKILNCSYNPINSLGASLPDSLQKLYCDHNGLTSLPALPSKLDYLQCGDINCSPGNAWWQNQIAVLPSLPSSLKTIYCCTNQISVMPSLPSGLQTLQCGYNPLSALPTLPPSLTFLLCDFTNIESLPTLPPLLNQLNVDNNKLSDLPPLPTSLKYLFCQNNNISCLPLLPNTLAGINVCGNLLNCLPNKPPGLSWGWQPCGAMPVCSSSNSTCHYNFISGKVYVDANDNCQYDTGELPIANQIIKLNNSLYASSDTSGYFVANTDTGAYIVDAKPAHPLLQINCPAIPYTVQLNDSLKNIDFPEKALFNCPWMWVDVATSRQRVCRKNFYVVNYCNYGSAVANGAYIDISFSPTTIPLSSTLPWSSVTGNTYRFNLGNVGVGECQSFTITDSVSCSAAQFETVCAHAEIFPKNNCFAPSTNWDNSHIEVSSQCANDSVVFKIKNSGTGNMSMPRSYRVFEDNVLISGNQIFQLPSADSLIVTFASDGKSWRLEADQDTAHPGMSRPRAFKELCGSPPYSMQLIKSVPQDDLDDDVEIHCIEVRNSCDPNVKSVQPAGITTDNLISAVDELEYTIEFQNKGNDTAYKVVVVDDLDANSLDISSIITGAASAPYSFEVFGTGVVKWTFDNINLTDTITNDLKSYGFVKFKVKQKSNNAPGTLINNSAAIFFDFNAAVITDTVRLMVMDVTIGIQGKNHDNKNEINIFPNPATTALFIRSNEKFKNVCCLNYLGKETDVKLKDGSINISFLPEGFYFLKIFTQDGKTVMKKFVKQ